MAMTMRQILAKTPQSRRDAADWVKVTAMKTRRSKAGWPLVLAQTIATHNPNGEKKRPPPQHKYVSTIEVMPKGHVIVSCSCEDFKFTWETALQLKGAAVQEYSNGQLPVDRNPAKIPGCCKHLYKMASILVASGKL